MFRITKVLWVVCLSLLWNVTHANDAAKADLQLMVGQKWMLSTPALADKNKPIYIMFTSNERLSGFAGCNSFQGGYILSPEHIFVLGMMSVTMSICEHDSSERQFFDFLGTKPIVAQPTPNTLHLKNEEDTYVFTLKEDAPKPEVNVNKLKQSVFAMINNKACAQNSQCKAMPYGVKPCGGPEGYLVYSTLHTDEDALKALTQEYGTLQRQQQKGGGLMGTCNIEQAPQVLCEQSACVAKPMRVTY